MKKLQFLVLSMVLSSSFFMNADWRADLAARQSAEKVRIASEMGAVATNASIAAFINSIASNVLIATAADTKNVEQSLEDAIKAFNQLYPRVESSKDRGSK